MKCKYWNEMVDCHLNGGNCRMFRKTDDYCNIIRKPRSRMVRVKAWVPRVFLENFESGEATVYKKFREHVFEIPVYIVIARKYLRGVGE